MKRKGPIFICLLLLLVTAFIAVKYFSPKVTIRREPTGNLLKPKFHYYDKDSLEVFIPYKFSISNNSFKRIKLKSIVCPDKCNGTIYSQLVYSQEGHETLMLEDYGNYATENFFAPFEKKYFYFYLPNVVAKNNFLNAEYVEDLYKKLPYQTVDKHIKNLGENVEILPKNDIILNLYKINKDRIVEITLTDKAVINKDFNKQIPGYEEFYIVKTRL